MTDTRAKATDREGLLRRARAVVAHGPNTSYPSRVSARQVRDVVAELLAALEAKGVALPTDERARAIEAVAKAMCICDMLGACADGPEIQRAAWQAYMPMAEAAITELERLGLLAGCGVPEGLSFNALRETNLSRCARWHPGGVKKWSLSDWGVATTGELGEAMNVVKKLNRERDHIVGNTVSEADLHKQLADEIADTVIYLDLLAAHEGIDLGAAVADKYNRTSEKNGFPERLAAAPTPPKETPPKETP